MKLELFVRNRQMTAKGLEPLVGDTAGYYTFTVAFDREWEDLVKVVVFQNADRTAQMIYKGEAQLPAQVAMAGDLYVACHGYRKEGDQVAVLRTVRMVKPLRLRASGPMAGDPAQEYTPSVFEQVMAAVGAANTAAQSAQRTRRELEQAAASGQFDGDTPVRGVDYWTEDDKSEIVEDVVERVGSGSGSGGTAGKDGYSPTAVVEQTDAGAVITITDKDGTTTAAVYNGEDGADGYTPVRGVDYWTAADIAEIKSYVDEAVLGGAW